MNKDLLLAELIRVVNSGYSDEGKQKRLENLDKKFRKLGSSLNKVVAENNIAGFKEKAEPAKKEPKPIEAPVEEPKATKKTKKKPYKFKPYKEQALEESGEDKDDVQEEEENKKDEDRD